MTKRGRGIAAGSVVLLLALLAAGWWFRHDIVGALLGPPEPVEVSPEVADAAEAKLRRLEQGEEARLSSIELSSLLRYRAQDWSAGALRDPGVRMSGEDVTITGIVPTDRLPSHPDLNAVRAFLPDSAAIKVHGRVAGIGGGRAAFEIRSVEFAGLPIPERYFSDVLERVGRLDEPGLAPHAVALRLPPAVSAVRVEDGYLILTP